MNKSNLIMSAK
jgi:hypothetical protein